MNLRDVFKKKGSVDVLHYVVLIEAPLQTVASQLAEWFSNSWRPSDSAVVYECTDKLVQVGTTCRATFRKMFNPSWNLEITQVDPNHFISAEVGGFFDGTETVTVEERDNGIKVDYHLNYSIHNPIHQLAWSLWLKEPFTAELRRSMEALRTYCLKVKP